MEKKKKIAFIIPYFGKLPNYFNLWLLSAESNKNYTFLLFTDAGPTVADNSNVKVIHTTFPETVSRFKSVLGDDIKLNSAYKLCDYKPAYGLVYGEYVKDYDFWGFCDLDLILGDLDSFLTEARLTRYDKLFFHGHFCLLRNTQKMNELFMEKYPNVLDWDYTKSTNYICHFDEDGTIAWTPKYDNTIKTFYKILFKDVSFFYYPIIENNEEAYAIWKAGHLRLYWHNGEQNKEIMYIHMQKRSMHDKTTEPRNGFCIARTLFFDCTNNGIITLKIPDEYEAEFYTKKKTRRTTEIFNNIKDGALRYRISSMIMKWGKR